jgi:formate dehydrogenase subunit gamma
MAERPGYLARFSRTERTLHWVHAAAFFLLLASGAVLYFPQLSDLVSRRQLVKGVHLYTAAAWVAALALIVLLGDRRGLRRAARELDGFDADDRRWLRGRGAPQGRFNAGQKLNAAITAALSVLFLVSGTLLWLGERNTTWRFASTIAVHDWVSVISVVLLSGHLYLAVLNPSTRHSLRGITRGDVRSDWAEAHHAKWAAAVTATRKPPDGAF